MASLAPGFVRNLKSLNVLLHLCLVLASWWAARTFFERPWPALTVAVLVAFNSSMLSTIDVFLTEIPAAAYPILGGLSLGTLALTKAVFFYFLILLVIGTAVWLATVAVRSWPPGRLPRS